MINIFAQLFFIENCEVSVHVWVIWDFFASLHCNNPCNPFLFTFSKYKESWLPAKIVSSVWFPTSSLDSVVRDFSQAVKPESGHFPRSCPSQVTMFCTNFILSMILTKRMIETSCYERSLQSSQVSFSRHCWAKIILCGQLTRQCSNSFYTIRRPHALCVKFKITSWKFLWLIKCFCTHDKNKSNFIDCQEELKEIEIILDCNTMRWQQLAITHHFSAACVSAFQWTTDTNSAFWDTHVQSWKYLYW